MSQLFTLQPQQLMKNFFWLPLTDGAIEPEDTCLFARFPIVEPPYSGSMNDTGFVHNYYTHYIKLTNEHFEDYVMTENEQPIPKPSDDAIHNWFSLSYAAYLVLPRSVLQSMPQDWQNDFVMLLERIPVTLDVDNLPNYQVSATSNNGRFVPDPYRDYQRGRRIIPHKKDFYSSH